MSDLAPKSFSMTSALLKFLPWRATGGSNPYSRKRSFSRLSVALFSIFLSLTTFSEASGSTPDAAPVNKDIIHGIELLYDLEFDLAENLFYKVIAENPKEPIGYFYLAMVNWSRLASGFWTDEVVKQYGKRIDRAIAIAKKKIELREADSLTYLYLGGALGFKGRFQLMKRKWLSSFFLATAAIEALKSCRRMDPENRDVFFGLGIFDYYTAKLSGALKFLTYLLLHKGNKEEGLRKLHVAADESAYSSVEAKSLLLHIDLFLEGRYEEALHLAQELSDRFRNDPRNKFLQGVAYVQLGRQSEYEKTIQYFRDRSREAGTPGKSLFWENWALYLEASYCLLNSQSDVARSKLNTILSTADPSIAPFMIGWPLLKTGMSHDLDGDREEALEHYKRVLEMENSAGAQFLALKYRDEPAKKRDPFLGY